MNNKVEYLFDDRELDDLDNTEIQIDEKFENEIVNRYLFCTNKGIINDSKDSIPIFLIDYNMYIE